MMIEIIRGTTPTITYSFNVVNVADIRVAYLTIRQGENVVIEKTLADATIDDNVISWTLSQQETLSLGVGASHIMLNWLLQDGTRGASNSSSMSIVKNDKNEVI